MLLMAINRALAKDDRLAPDKQREFECFDLRFVKRFQIVISSSLISDLP